MSRYFANLEAVRKVGMGALLALVMPAIPAPAQVFLVTGANGQAQVGRDQHSYQPAVVNSNHSLPSWGRTGDNSSLTIAFNAENKFRLLPNSEAQVYAGDGDSNSAWHRVVGLKIGTATISHDTGAAPAVKLDCETPTAVCGAVGTEFEVDATEGKYSVSQGRISLISHQEGDLVMPRIVGGTVVFNPGAQNTYSNGDFSGVVILDGVTMQAAGADFTVAKKLDSSSETAVHIASGRLGGTGPGDYVMEGGRLKPVDPSKASIHPQYLAAAKREGALSVERAALRASSNRVAPRGLDAALSAAAARATALREELFNRETAREVNKQVTGALIDSALRGGR